MDIKIFWMNGIHGDPDNIFKGIADALFKNDKFLDGSFESHYSQDGKGRVEISITLDI
jgi:Holliday junction resolvase RusA-like endonuclease